MSNLTRNPQWVESYPTGFVNLENHKISQFKPTILKYDYALQSSKQILEHGNNLKMNTSSLFSKTKTEPLTYETFGCQVQNNLNSNNKTSNNLLIYFLVILFFILLVTLKKKIL